MGAIAGPRELPGSRRLNVAARRHGEVAVYFARVTTNCTQALWVRYGDLVPIAHQYHLSPLSVGHHERP